MSAPGVISVKRFTYRGAMEEWTNGYHFVGDAPANPTEWDSLFNALWDMEKLIFSPTTFITRAYGYEDFSPGHTSVYSLDLVPTSSEIAGTFTALDQRSAGDQASTCRWKTARFTSKGKPIYLRKYYHDIQTTAASGEGDNLESAYKTALTTLATDLNTISGDWPGIAGPDGVAPGASEVMPFATTRTLKRRGKRPNP